MELKKHMSFTETSDFLISLVSSSPFGIIAIDLTGEITIANALAKKHLEIKTGLNKLPEMHILDCIYHIPALCKHIELCLEKGRKPFDLEAIWLNDKCLTFRGRLLLDGFLLTIENITKIKELEANTIQSILVGQEKERRRIGRDIHDGFGPLLSSVKLSLNSFSDKLKHYENKIPMEQLEDAITTIDDIANDLRELSHKLMPKVLDDFGLKAAFNNLIWIFDGTTKTELNFYCNFEKEIRFDKEIELNIYRCAQEILNNALKYAQAKTILVQLIKHASSIVLMIEDNGKGFSKNRQMSDNYGIGLTNIETRVRMLDGEFIMDSHEGRGTTVSIEIPLE